MPIDYKPFFKKYEALAAMADEVFERVKKEYADCVKCKTECSDCCHALFDLSLIEALYIHHQFFKRFDGEKKAQLIDRSNTADRKIYKIKKKAYKALEAGKSEMDILAAMAEDRVRCPLLNDKERCDLYENRPITCRLYGIPTSIAGTGHTCGKSA
ncbi:MAG: YkgJ family cysteine cluster protein, partial [Desulfobacterales bacterium]